MNSLSDFKTECINIFNQYEINKVTWIQFIPLEEDLIYEINIISIDDKPFGKLDKSSKLAWESFFKLLSNFKFLSQQFGNNVEVTISRSEILITEYNF
jgi:hypothetical protein